MIKNVKRISIVGGCGSGKTTLADNISKEMNIPVYHLDGMHYDANWVEKSKVERDKVILEKIQEDAWVIDGVYRSTLERRLNRSDLVIFLDMDPEISQKLMSGRYSGDENKKDIHEKDVDYLNMCRKAAFYSADKLDWKIVKCYDGDEPLKIEEISSKIIKLVDEVL